VRRRRGQGGRKVYGGERGEGKEGGREREREKGKGKGKREKGKGKREKGRKQERGEKGGRRREEGGGRKRGHTLAAAATLLKIIFMGTKILFSSLICHSRLFIYFTAS
jgi:hypothetical protein